MPGCWRRAGCHHSRSLRRREDSMRYSLVNPRWSFAGSIYFGCREPHLPLEYGYARALLEAAGHEAVIIDAQLRDLDDAAVRAEVAAFGPELTVLTTAPSYLFWR